MKSAWTSPNSAARRYQTSASRRFWRSPVAAAVELAQRHHRLQLAVLPRRSKQRFPLDRDYAARPSPVIRIIPLLNWANALSGLRGLEKQLGARAAGSPAARRRRRGLSPRRLWRERVPFQRLFRSGRPRAPYRLPRPDRESRCRRGRSDPRARPAAAAFSREIFART